MPPLLSEEEAALDPYSLLDLVSGASEKEVRKAYKMKSLRYHPDKASSSLPSSTLRTVLPMVSCC